MSSSSLALSAEQWAVVVRYLPKVRQVSRSIRRHGWIDGDAWYDVALDGVIRAVARWPRGYDNPGLHGWVGVTIRFSIMDMFRRIRRSHLDQGRSLESWEVLGASWPGISDLERVDSFESLLGPARPRQAAVLRLRYLDGLKTSEVAGRLGLKPARVAGLEHDGLNVLYRAMTGHEGRPSRRHDPAGAVSG